MYIIYIAEMQKRKRPILCYSELHAFSAINALYFVHRAPYGGEDSTVYVIYIYIYILNYFICSCSHFSTVLASASSTFLIVCVLPSRGHIRILPFSEVKHRLKEYTDEEDHWFYILRYNPESR